MQVMVAAFVRRGLVERRPDPENQRILRIFLTDEDGAVLSRSQEAADRIERGMLAGLTNAQIEGFSSTLETGVRNLTTGPRAAG
jgi:DNA-binding MarR family transcriptional regulator